MKKLFSGILMPTLAVCIIASCSKEDVSSNPDAEISQSTEEDSVIDQQLDIKVSGLDDLGDITYHFEGKAFVDSEENKNTSFLDKSGEDIFDLPNLVVYYDGSENIKLFRNFDEYQKFDKKELSDSSEREKTASNRRYGYTKLYEHKDYKGDYFRTYMYSDGNRNIGSGFISFNNTAGTRPWNDRASSIIVYNARIIFYEHPMNLYSGAVPENSKSFVIDDKNDKSRALGLKNLKGKKMKWFKSWNDQISALYFNSIYDY